MKLIQRWIFIALFLASVAAITMFLPRSLEQSIGDGFQLDNIPRAEVTVGDESVVLEKDDQAFIELTGILNRTDYTRTFTDKGEPVYDQPVTIRFANGDEWRWEYVYQGGASVELGPSWSMKTCSVEESETLSQELSTFLEAQGLS